MNVGRERSQAEPFQKRLDTLFGETDHSVFRVLPPLHLSPVTSAERDLLPLPETARTLAESREETVPQGLNEKKLHRHTVFPLPYQLHRFHPGVVNDQKIAGGEKAGKVAEPGLNELLPFFGNHQEP